jgi:hypothetical protein
MVVNMTDTKSISSTLQDKCFATTAIQNVLIKSVDNVPVAELVHSRNNITSDEIRNLSIEIFNQSKQGTTFNDLVSKYNITKRRAQRKLKECCRRKVLFVPEFENHKPQRYYPLCLRAGVLEYLSKKNVQVRPTVSNQSSFFLPRRTRNPLYNVIEHQKAQNLLDILISIGHINSPLYIHKLHLHLSIDKECYHQLLKHDQLYPQNKSKVIEERIGKTIVKYTYSPNGKLQVYIACSNNPFRIQTEQDEAALFAFLGQVKDRILYHVSDPAERIVPPLLSSSQDGGWRLVQCDINKDIEVSDMMQLTGLNLQLEYLERVFRLYIKSTHDKSVCRAEESLTVNMPIFEALKLIRDGNKSGTTISSTSIGTAECE